MKLKRLLYLLLVLPLIGTTSCSDGDESEYGKEILNVNIYGSTDSEYYINDIRIKNIYEYQGKDSGSFFYSETNYSLYEDTHIYLYSNSTDNEEYEFVRLVGNVALEQHVYYMPEAKTFSETSLIRECSSSESPSNTKETYQLISNNYFFVNLSHKSKKMKKGVANYYVSESTSLFTLKQSILSDSQTAVIYSKNDLPYQFGSVKSVSIDDSILKRGFLNNSAPMFLYSSPDASRYVLFYTREMAQSICPTYVEKFQVSLETKVFYDSTNKVVKIMYSAHAANRTEQSIVDNLLSTNGIILYEENMYLYANSKLYILVGSNATIEITKK